MLNRVYAQTMWNSSKSYEPLDGILYISSDTFGIPSGSGLWAYRLSNQQRTIIAIYLRFKFRPFQTNHLKRRKPDSIKRTALSSNGLFWRNYLDPGAYDSTISRQQYLPGSNGYEYVCWENCFKAVCAHFVLRARK